MKAVKLQPVPPVQCRAPLPSWLNLPFPVRQPGERAGPAANAGEKVPPGKTPFNHKQHMLKISW